MNLQHLRYALEVNSTGSINQAAENLYMSQPNLSKAIKEFEKELGYKIFNRTSKGITTTKKGEIFLLRGMKILSDIKELENTFKSEGSSSGLSFLVPRYFPFSSALSDMLNSPECKPNSSWQIIEMDEDNTLQQIIEGQNSLGIIRYPSIYDLYVKQYLRGKCLASKLLAHNARSLIFSKNSPLAELPAISKENLDDQIELQLYVKVSRHLPEGSILGGPSLEYETLKKPTFLFSDTSSALGVLISHPNIYMVSPSPLTHNILQRYGLCQTLHWDDSVRYNNRLIYSHSHIFSSDEKLFIDGVLKSLAQENATIVYENKDYE